MVSCFCTHHAKKSLHQRELSFVYGCIPFILCSQARALVTQFVWPWFKRPKFNTGWISMSYSPPNNSAKNPSFKQETPDSQFFMWVWFHETMLNKKQSLNQHEWMCVCIASFSGLSCVYSSVYMQWEWRKRPMKSNLFMLCFFQPLQISPFLHYRMLQFTVLVAALLVGTLSHCSV